MDLQDTPKEAEFRAEARAWLDENAPHELLPQLQQSGFGKSAFSGDEYVEHCQSWQAKKADARWACIHWPEEYGGRGASAMERIIWGQEEGPYAALSGLFVIGLGMAGPTLMAYGTEEQKRQYLPPMARGEEIWCQLFSEPGAGSDLAGIRTRAVQDGDEWVINGQKIWTSGAQYSKHAILVTRSDPSLPKHKGLTYFFIDMDAPGIDVRGIKQVAGESAFNEVFFTNLRVSDDHRLGQVGDGWAVALTTLMNERQAIGSGLPTGFDELLKYVVTLDGEDGRLIDDPDVRDKMADWYVRTSGLRYTSLRAISAISQGGIPGPENSIGKVVAGQTLQEVATFATEIQELGGTLTNPDQADWDAKFQAMMLRSLGVRIEGGTDEILKNIIAERVLGLPGDIRVDRDVPFSEIPTGR